MTEGVSILILQHWVSYLTAQIQINADECELTISPELVYKAHC